jgi:hypothetical protein
MLNFLKLVRPLSLIVVILLCTVTIPVTKADNGGPVLKNTNTTQQETKQSKSVTQKPAQKSVFDADMLERPLSFFRNSYDSEDDNDDSSLFSHSTTIIIAFKALIASLLSTII